MDAELVEIFSDELNLRMIASVSERPRSARELALLLRIPVSRTYRRIKRLENAGILAVRDRVPSGFGKRENLYESRLRTFEIIYEVGSVRVNCIVEGRAPIRVDEQFREEIMTKLQTPWTESAEAPLTQGTMGGPSPMA
jgi:DNA-binding Lrp family transcriptional regulator